MSAPTTEPYVNPAAREPHVPALSVVVVVFAGGDAPGRCIDALAAQRDAGPYEVIVAHDASFAPPSGWERRLPGVRTVAGARGDSPARLRALGVAAAWGMVVACTEDHCVPAPDWACRILGAHGRGGTVVGGAIDKVSPASSGAWAAYLLDYSRYMRPLAAGPAEYASDCNVSYDRAALDEVRDSWRGDFHETTVNWALRAKGHAIVLDPTILVSQDRKVSLAAYLRERIAHGRVFAGTRLAGASLVQRAKWSLFAVPLPAVLVGRVFGRLAQKKALSAPPVAAWPALAASAIAWSLGELTGYVTGRGE